ncbi:MAG: type II toxin-antitoxin system HicB family antitoxin [Hyphomicrobiaceae bacterium]|nr:type II toxin-antitoxin system HicB family antitoxin [Hyphomicrobiaceae bacterium]
MAKHTYTIILEPQADGGFTVTVPALPEIVTEGDTEAEAMANATEAIELALEHRRESGLAIPPNSASQVREVTVEAAA